VFGSRKAAKQNSLLSFEGIEALGPWILDPRVPGNSVFEFIGTSRWAYSSVG